ncbi:hypothetical protein KW805_03120 [Candidatus Pacearchaeota archaeon]|nr:hypothetical protein [Candidatus Pacearchaeota archaeon]
MVGVGDLYVVLVLFPVIGLILLIRGIYLLRNSESLTTSSWITPRYTKIRNSATTDKWWWPRFKFFGIANARPVAQHGKVKAGTPSDIFGKEKALAYVERLGKIYIFISVIFFIISLIVAIYLFVL